MAHTLSAKCQELILDRGKLCPFKSTLFFFQSNDWLTGSQFIKHALIINHCIRTMKIIRLGYTVYTVALQLDQSNRVNESSITHLKIAF